jgi:glutathione S-transferase
MKDRTLFLLFALSLFSESPASALAAIKTNKMNPEVRLITNKMCPYAQKAWLSLECSKIPYDLEEISLYGAGGKPDWFWELNPAGTVPVLVVAKQQQQQQIYPDSDLILQAITDGSVQHDNPLMSKSDDRVEEWRRAVNEMLPVGKKAVLGGGKAQLAQLLKNNMENRLEDGAMFLTGSISIADCHAFPFLWRLDQEYGLAKGLQCPKLGAWVESCSKLPEFRKTMQSSWWWWW